MTKYNLHDIMLRAWELVKKTGITISEGLRKAWKESKESMSKIKFEGYAKVLKPGYPGVSESNFLFFKRWQKNGKNRIYVNDYKRRTIGFFENGEFVKYDNCGVSADELDGTLNAFRSQYEF